MFIFFIFIFLGVLVSFVFHLFLFIVFSYLGSSEVLASWFALFIILFYFFCFVFLYFLSKNWVISYFCHNRGFYFFLLGFLIGNVFIVLYACISFIWGLF